MDGNMEGISSTINMFKHVNMYLSKEKINLSMLTTKHVNTCKSLFVDVLIKAWYSLVKHVIIIYTCMAFTHFNRIKISSKTTWVSKDLINKHVVATYYAWTCELKRSYQLKLKNLFKACMAISFFNSILEVL